MNSEFSRRDFLKLAGFISAATVLWGCTPYSISIPTFVPPIVTASDEDQLIYAVLKRITFGPRPAEIERVHQIGLDAFIEEQLAYDSIEDNDLSPRLADLTTIRMSPSDLVTLDKRGQSVNELVRATVLRAVYSRRQLYEVMVNFWSDHFNIYILKNRILKTVDDRQVIRQLALGNFKDLLFASMHSPAMLAYLDNAVSTKDRPNENYARELLELHTLGVDAEYTQHDINEVARALTGWSVTGILTDTPREFIFREQNHDYDRKTILGTYFQSGQGIQDGEQLADLLVSHPSTATRISYKLVRRFVSDDPPPALVSQAAAVFQTSRGDIRAILSLILHSEEFRASLGVKLKRPFEFVVSLLRQTDAETTFDKGTMFMLRQMGQLPFYWPAPDGYPDVGAAWLNSNDLLNRWNLALSLAANALPDTKIDWDALVHSITPTEQALDLLSIRLLGNILPGGTRRSILDLISDFAMVDPLIPISALLVASPYFQYR